MLALTLSVLGIHLLTSVATGTASPAGPSPEFTGNTTLVIATLLSMAVSVASLIRSGKRQPPVAEEMHEKFVRREEWDQSGQRLHERIDTTQEKIEDLSNRANKGFQDLEGAMGRIAGQLKEMGRNLRRHDDEG